LSRFAIALPIMALAFLSFIAGTFIIYFELYPYESLDKVYKGLKAQYYLNFVADNPREIVWLDQRTMKATADPSSKEIEIPLKLQQFGLINYDESLSFGGYTIFSAGPASYPIQLLDIDGNPVHEWTLPVKELQGPSIDIDLGDWPQLVQIRRVKLQPDGSLLLVLCFYETHTPYGMGVVKLDKDSNIVWQNMNNAHHDVEAGSDGKVYVLTHDIKTEPPNWPKSIKAPYLSENITILDDQGAEIKTISVLTAMQDSRFSSTLRFIDGGQQLGDIMHANSIDVLEKDIKIKIPGAKPGDILISIRNTDTLALIDPETELVTWATRGIWHRQHDADFLANGNLLLFDNKGRMEGTKRTRILEFDPETREIVWCFPDDDKDLLSSHMLGSQQRLANGNTLITESMASRIIEVTPANQIVWEYALPHLVIRNTDDQPRSADAYSAERFSRAELQFEFNRLEPIAAALSTQD
jgi:hypothetical protein